MDDLRMILEDYQSYCRERDDKIERIEISRDTEATRKLEKETEDLLGTIYDSLASLASKNESITELCLPDLRELLSKECSQCKTVRDAQISLREEKEREKWNLDARLFALKEELVSIQRDNEAIETQLNDRESLPLALRLMKSN